jgi:hypothetical protein
MSRTPERPTAAIVSGVGALLGVLPAALFALFGAFFLIFALAGIVRGQVLLSLGLAQLCLFAVGLPVLLVLGAVRLLRGRDRLLLVLSCLPVTLFAVGWLVTPGEIINPWLLLLLLGPAVAPLFALAPSVGRWLAAHTA